MLVVALFAEKSKKNQTEHVKRGQQGCEQTDGVENVAGVGATVFALKGAEKDGVLAEEARERRKARDGQSGGQHRNVGPLDFLAQTAHAAHVLLAAHGVNHAACGEEEKRFEKGV